jgi:hypothetical protein
MNAYNTCIERQRKKEQDAKDAAYAAKRAAEERTFEAQRSLTARQIHDFVDAIRIGMTATEVTQVEAEIFHNPAGWGKIVNTTVTANGTTQQWVYRFSNYQPSGMYLYLSDGMVSAIQK